MKIQRAFRRAVSAHILCGLLTHFLGVPAGATTLVALIDKYHHRAVVAADSLLIYKVADKTTQTCKIVTKPGCTIGMSGLFYKEYPVFHLQELADQACGTEGDLRYKADSFLSIAKEPVTAVAQYMQQNEPDLYRDMTNNNAGELIMVIFAGPEVGEASIFARGYKLDANGGITPVSMDVTEENNGAGYFGGANQQIAAYIQKHPNWDFGDKVKTARKFVQMEIKAHPEWVGPPVSVVTVNRLDQQKWVNPGVCTVPAPTQKGKKKKN